VRVAHLECAVISTATRSISRTNERAFSSLGRHGGSAKHIAAKLLADLRDEPVTVFGDGEQTRGNTYVADCVDATVRAASHGQVGQVYNVGGGESRSTNWVVDTIQRIVGRRVAVTHGPPRPGEQREALAITTKARQSLGWAPRVSLEDGLRAQVEWQRTLT